jgi:hypothetical protein
LAVVGEPGLDPQAEAVRQRPPGAQVVEELAGGVDPLRGQVEGERWADPVVLVGVEGGAQHRGAARLGQARGVDIAVGRRAGRSSGARTLEPAPAAEPRGARPSRSLGGQALGRQRGDPGVEAMRRRVEVAGQEALELADGAAGQGPRGGAQPAQVIAATAVEPGARDAIPHAADRGLAAGLEDPIGRGGPGREDRVAGQEVEERARARPGDRVRAQGRGAGRRVAEDRQVVVDERAVAIGRWRRHRRHPHAQRRGLEDQLGQRTRHRGASGDRIEGGAVPGAGALEPLVDGGQRRPGAIGQEHGRRFLAVGGARGPADRARPAAQDLDQGAIEIAAVVQARRARQERPPAPA